MDKKELKKEKKLYKKAFRKAKRPWKGLAVLSCILAVILSLVTVVAGLFDNTLSIMVGGKLGKLVNEDPAAQYFKSDFDSVEEMAAYGLELCYRVEAEGAVLLKNDNNALPLQQGAKVSLLSNSSVNIVYGGTGSGNIDASSASTLKDAMEKSGFTVNETLWNFYGSDAVKQYKADRGGLVTTTAASVSEVPWSCYTDEVKSSISSFGDAAVVVLSRVGGEGADLTHSAEDNYLALDANERELLSQLSEMKKAGQLSKIVVLINTANALQVDFLKGDPYGIDAALWIGDVGISGIDAAADILAGKVNPSGSLADTYCYDNYSSPSMYNFTPVTYSGDLKSIPDTADTYMIYQEGIYVGYKYYETRYEDAVMGTGNTAGYVYGDDVAYPFGFGLSYTTFEYSDAVLSYDAAKKAFTLQVTVTNTGAAAGKEPVQVYVQSPYTDYDRENGVEKAAVALCGFGKTGELAPGKSEKLTISVDLTDIASYDAYGKGTYILDAGTYYFTVATDAHNAVNNILAKKGYAGKTDAPGNEALVCAWENAAFDAESCSTSLNGTPITNRLSDADPNLYAGVTEQVTWLSRKDWAGTLPRESVKIALTEQLTKALQLVTYDPAAYPAATMPTMGAKNGLKLLDLMGKDYDDPQWEKLLDQMTFDEMVDLIGDSFHWTQAIESVQAPATRDENGPQGLTASLFGSNNEKIAATAFTSEDVMAATFSTEIMGEIGKVIANNCIVSDIAFLYGPGCNIHRNPYCGRNFEYFSEDGFLSGEMCKHEVAEMVKRGVQVALKHFALNDCEQDRIGQAVWLNEQAAREIYLKAFQGPVEESKGGVMVGYTRWGAAWSGAFEGLMSGILRGEWGSIGLNITDNVLTQYVNGVDAMMAGGVSTFDAMLWYVTSQLPAYKADAVVVNAMREACHHTLYTVANGVGMNGIGPDTVVKRAELSLLTYARIGMIFFWALFVLSMVMLILRKRKFRQSPEYRRYMEIKKNA